jgi:hypothetical protein
VANGKWGRQKGIAHFCGFISTTFCVPRSKVEKRNRLPNKARFSSHHNFPTLSPSRHTFYGEIKVDVADNSSPWSSTRTLNFILQIDNGAEKVSNH